MQLSHGSALFRYHKHMILILLPHLRRGGHPVHPSRGYDDQVPVLDHNANPAIIGCLDVKVRRTLNDHSSGVLAVLAVLE